jgi:hypothetical protein
MICGTRAGNGTRTRDPNLGKVVLYQLSYSRIPHNRTCKITGSVPYYYPTVPTVVRQKNGGEGNRTPDLVNAIHALSQLSYAPAIFDRLYSHPDGNTASYRTVETVSTDTVSTGELRG